MKLYAGTSGYSYKEWKGPFYPEKIPAKEMLSFYSSQLPTVEINNTFYRMPKRDVVENWCAQVPQDFRFVVKAPQRITHFKRLRGAESELEYFLEVVSIMEDRLGMLLFQLPPNFKKDAERLDDFLDELPQGTRAAFEFRHDSWADEEIHNLLAKRNLALCVADTEDKPGVMVRTADYGYLRLRRPDYDDGALKRWLQETRAQSWSEGYVFFKHEDAGAGPLMAARFLEMSER